MQSRNFLCFLFILLSNKTFAQHVQPVSEPLVVNSVDFFFDGGSIEIRLDKADGTKLLLMLVNPNSPFATRVKPPYSILTTSQPRFRADEAESISKVALETLLKKLISSNSKTQLHTNVCGVLLAVHAGFEPVTWGADAVEAIEEGSWLSLFQKNAQASKSAPAVDPFK